jgi:hypothetical protein
MYEMRITITINSHYIMSINGGKKKCSLKRSDANPIGHCYAITLLETIRIRITIGI